MCHFGSRPRVWRAVRQIGLPLRGEDRPRSRSRNVSQGEPSFEDPSEWRSHQMWTFPESSRTISVCTSRRADSSGWPMNTPACGEQSGGGSTCGGRSWSGTRENMTFHASMRWWMPIAARVCECSASSERRLLSGPAPRARSSTLPGDRKSTRLNSSHGSISYAVFCLKKKKHSEPLKQHREDHLNDDALDHGRGTPQRGLGALSHQVAEHEPHTQRGDVVAERRGLHAR